MNDADKRIEWKARYDAWKTSGLSAAEWSRSQGIKTHQLYYWIRKFREDEVSQNEPHVYGKIKVQSFAKEKCRVLH